MLPIDATLSSNLSATTIRSCLLVGMRFGSQFETETIHGRSVSPSEKGCLLFERATLLVSFARQFYSKAFSFSFSVSIDT
jgi:hypothetical protein